MRHEPMVGSIRGSSSRDHPSSLAHMNDCRSTGPLDIDKDSALTCRHHRSKCIRCGNCKPCHNKIGDMGHRYLDRGLLNALRDHGNRIALAQAELTIKEQQQKIRRMEEIAMLDERKRALHALGAGYNGDGY